MSRKDAIARKVVAFRVVIDGLPVRRDPLIERAR
jgi:hypothetical protein